MGCSRGEGRMRGRGVLAWPGHPWGRRLGWLCRTSGVTSGLPWVAVAELPARGCGPEGGRGMALPTVRVEPQTGNQGQSWKPQEVPVWGCAGAQHPAQSGFPVAAPV